MTPDPFSCPAPTLGPDARQCALLPNPRFVLEPDGDLLAGVFLLYFFDKKGASSTHLAIACGSDLRCSGRGTKTDRLS